MSIIITPGDELGRRMHKFTNELDKAYDNWELCAIAGAVNLFYLTGTVCDGVLILRRGRDYTLWVRRNYDRSILESAIADIRPMHSYREVAASLGALPDTVYLDTAYVTLEWSGLFRKHLPFKNILPVNDAMFKARAVKTEYELERMRRSGASMARLLTQELPGLMYEGISEAELGAELLALTIKNGHQGNNRFHMRNASDLLGHIAFGKSSLFPGVFNGASGITGICPAMPVLGSHARKLCAGDIVFIDACFATEGYHIDKTLIYCFRGNPPEYIKAAHDHCLELMRKGASLLKPGARPSDIYNEVLADVRPEFSHHFMGIPGRAVPFLGHSIGLYVDEPPVIALGFDEPIEAGMTFAIEPKMGFEGIGMVGGENTYLVTENGGVSLTGEPLPIIMVD